MADIDLPSQAAAVRRRLGVVSHLPLLYGDLTAEENLQFFARMYGVQEADKRIAEVLDLVGLAARRRDLVRTFSRGMQQRLAIGRAVLHDPDVILFDEPHTGLDQDACVMLDRRAQRSGGSQPHGGDDLPRPGAGGRPGDAFRCALSRRDRRFCAPLRNRPQQPAGILPPGDPGGMNAERPAAGLPAPG